MLETVTTIKLNFKYVLCGAGNLVRTELLSEHHLQSLTLLEPQVVRLNDAYSSRQQPVQPQLPNDAYSSRQQPVQPQLPNDAYSSRQQPVQPQLPNDAYSSRQQPVQPQLPNEYHLPCLQWKTNTSLQSFRSRWILQWSTVFSRVERALNTDTHDWVEIRILMCVHENS